MSSLIPTVFRPLRLALIQLATTADKQFNLQRASLLVKEACTNGANVVVLPVDVSKFSNWLTVGMLQQSCTLGVLLDITDAYSMALNTLLNTLRLLILRKRALRNCVRWLRLCLKVGEIKGLGKFHIFDRWFYSREKGFKTIQHF